MSAEPDRPSARAVERLATGVGADVANLRTQLRRALDEADRLQAAGRDDLAVSVLQEQRDTLLAVHQRLEARLADAAVEREAERVLGGVEAVEAPDVALARPTTSPPPVPAVAAGDDGMALRLVASAVAAVLGVALLLSPELGAGDLAAAGSAGASDAPPKAAASQADDVAGDAETIPPTTPADRAVDAAERAANLRALALPEADALPMRAGDEAGTSDTAPEAMGEFVSLPDVGPSIDSLTSVAPGMPADDEGDDDEGTAGSDGDEGTAGQDDQEVGDDAPPDEPGQDDGEQPSSQDAAADPGTGDDADGGTDDDASAGDSTGDDQTDSGDHKRAPDADDEGSVSDGLEVDAADEESLATER